MKSLFVILGLVGLLNLACAADAAPVIGDVDNGRKVFAACAACHRESSEEVVPNPGPDLRGVYGRPAGSVPGFRYSRALRNAKRTWNEDTLFAFLADPQAAIPGNAMPFPGLPDEAQRRDVIAYLKTFK